MNSKAKISNYKLKKIKTHFCVDIESSKTAYLVGINRNTVNQKYLWFRRAIYLHQIMSLEDFIGDVELDESYFGGRRLKGFHGKLKRGRGTLKQPVFGIFKREDALGRSKVYTEIIPDAKKQTIIGVIHGKIDPSSIIHTDGWRGYDGLVDVGYDKHLRVNHGDNEFALDGENGAVITVNGIESFWSFTKRRLAKFNGVGKYFDLHLKECEWRWGKSVKELEQELDNILFNYDNFFDFTK
jgi:transposase